RWPRTATPSSCTTRSPGCRSRPSTASGWPRWARGRRRAPRGCGSRARRSRRSPTGWPARTSCRRSTGWTRRWRCSRRSRSGGSRRRPQRRKRQRRRRRRRRRRRGPPPRGTARRAARPAASPAARAAPDPPVVDDVALSVEEARLLHDELLVFDLHADTPKLIHRLGYDIADRHERRRPRQVSYFGHVDIPRMREGGVGAQVFGMWTWPYPQRGCAASVHGQLDALGGAVDKSGGDIAFCLSGEDGRRARAAGRIAALAGIEGGQALEGEIDNLVEFARRGVRTLGLVHFTVNAIAAPAYGVGARAERGLSDFGRDVIAEMNRLGVIVDLAHINRTGFFEAIEASRDPVYVTHTGVAGAHPHWRNIDDEQ